MKKIFLEETSSTNQFVRQFEEEAVVCARRQTGGMGTKGRSFLSEAGGVYLSFLTFPNIPASHAFGLIAHAAVAVCRTAEHYGAHPHIKWPNDVLIAQKKLCGILTENTVQEGNITRSIVGIGLNVANDVSALGGIAVTLSEAVGRSLDPATVRDTLIEQFQIPSTFFEYRGFVRFLGSPITVTEGDFEYGAVAKEILPDGRLEIDKDGERRLLSSAEIHLKWEEV